jgi:hypothetical protein
LVKYCFIFVWENSSFDFRPFEGEVEIRGNGGREMGRGADIPGMWRG